MIGVFGGTFDPPHLAHLVLADEARHQLGLEKVLWILTPVSPLKPDITISPYQVRLILLEAALKDNHNFEVSRVDIDRPAPHYAYQTLKIIARKFTKDKLIYLMGSDSLIDFPRWKKPEEILNNCHALGVMQRPGEVVEQNKLEAEIPGIRGNIRWVQAPLLDISSSEIRNRLRTGQPVRYYLLREVYEIIRENQYYSQE